MSARAALITGSSRGIGKAIALALANEGYGIAVNAPAEDAEMAAAVRAVQELGVPAVAAIGDVGDIAGHDAMLAQAEAALGPLTTLVNNAGVSVLQRGDLLEATPESYDRCQQVNARGAFFLTQAWARRLLARDRDPEFHHCVITISSSNAEAASIQRGEYCVSKAAAAMVTKLFAVRLGPEEIGSYEIRPGLIETAMTVSVQAEYRRRIDQGLTVAQRMGQPQDIASIAVAMANGNLAFCTGQAVHADGGLLLARF